MLLGFNTNGLQNHRLEDGLRLLADHGFQSVGLTLDVGHLDPFRCSAGEVAAVARLLDELHLRPTIETGARFLLDPEHKHEPTLMNPDPACRDRRLDFYARAAAIGRDLGAEVLSFWSGVDRWCLDDSAGRLEAGVNAACARIRAAGLRPALEPEPGMAVATVAEFETLTAAIAAVGGEPPELCLDIGHLYVIDEGVPASVIGRLAGRLAMVQIADMRRGVHEHLMPGQGDVDFGAALRGLAEAGYRGQVQFELSRSSHCAPQAVAAAAMVWQRFMDHDKN